MEFKLNIIRQLRSYTDIREKLAVVMEEYLDVFPGAHDAKILLKPNCNSNMSALTGNTTDLRILSALIQLLKDRGYTNIVVGEGTNSGFYRNNIGVMARLKVDALAKYYGVKIKDLNYAEPYQIEFDQGVKAAVAKECIEADLFINLPTLKTHFENGMTVCLKNLMGCLIGQENKKKTHDNLPENILRINQQVKPHLHIVDALIAMEGLGPTRGTPVRLDTLLVGTDPYLLDLACARIAGFDYRQVRTLALAEHKGILTEAHHRFVDSLHIEHFQKKIFDLPKAGPLATFIHSPKRQKFFLKIRNTAFFSYLASTDWFGHLLFLTGLRQDVFTQAEMTCNRLSLNKENCTHCGICQDVCPLSLPLPDYLTNMDDRCIRCLYCYSICPERAIEFEGEFGFFEEQLRQYDTLLRRLYTPRRKIETCSDQTVTIVSGLPRSGTSMMMKMLQAGGMELVVDNIREADEDNPKGYFEFELVKKTKDDASWVRDASGKAVKMISMLLYDLPMEYRYKVIFMCRNMQEILASQRRMLERQGRNSADDDEKMDKLFTKHLDQVEQWLRQQTNIESLSVNYHDVIDRPEHEAERVNQFLGSRLNVKNMVEVVDTSLYRNRGGNVQ